MEEQWWRTWFVLCCVFLLGKPSTKYCGATSLCAPTSCSWTITKLDPKTNWFSMVIGCTMNGTPTTHPQAHHAAWTWKPSAKKKKKSIICVLSDFHDLNISDFCKDIVKNLSALDTTTNYAQVKLWVSVTESYWSLSKWYLSSGLGRTISRALHSYQTGHGKSVPMI